MTDTDERAVVERIDTVSQLLQAFRSRGRGLGHFGSREDEAIGAITSFRDRVTNDGWTTAFDAVVAELRALASEAPEAERTEVDRMIDYLIGIENAVVRLASHRDRKTAASSATESLFVVPSRIVPSVHPDDRVRPGAVSRFVEPLAIGQLERSARDALEEIAALSNLRRPSDEDSWVVGADFERRLLECVDVVATYRRGRTFIDVEALAVKLARDYPVVDGSKWFAAAFLLACTSGDRAMTALRQMILDAKASTSAGLIDAVCLGSSPLCRTLALSLLDEDDQPNVLALGLVCSLRLGLFDEARMAPLIDHPSDRVASLAVRCLGHGDGKSIAPAIVSLLDRPGVALDAALVLTMFKAEVGLQHLRQTIELGLTSRAIPDEVSLAERAACLLALAGKKRDEELLLRFAANDDDVLVALADHGSPSFLPMLVNEMLGAARPSRAFAAAHTLSRMTGVAMRAVDEEGEAHTFDVQVFAKRVSGWKPPVDADRLRLGKQLELRAALSELVSSSTSQGARRRTARDVMLLRGAPLDFDLDGWVGTQRRSLEHALAAKDSAA
jgi:hypothetical protein